MTTASNSRRRPVIAVIGHPRWADRRRRSLNRVQVLAAIQRADLIALEIYEFHDNPITDELTRQRLRRHLRLLHRHTTTHPSSTPASTSGDTSGGTSSSDDSNQSDYAGETQPPVVTPFGSFGVPLPLKDFPVLRLPDPLLDD